VSHKGSSEWDLASCTADRAVSRALANEGLPSHVWGFHVVLESNYNAGAKQVKD